MKGTIYNRNTGVIMSTVEAGDEDVIRLQCTLDPAYEAWIGEALDNTEWWFVDGKPVRVAQMDLKFSHELDQEELEVRLEPGEVLRVDNIPKNSVIVHPDGVLTGVDDGYIEWSVDHPGSYYIGIFCSGMSGVKFNAVVK